MTMRRRDVLQSGLAAFAASALPLPARACPLAEIGGRAFGTTWRALIPGAADRERIAARITWLLDALDRALSPFRDDSELARLNRAAGSATLSAPLATVVREGLAIARATNGAFDPTVGPVVARYGFGPIGGDSSRGAATGGDPGFALSGRTVTKREPGLTFDPCGIGKGYALDAIGDLLAANGIDAFFADFGGEVLVRGLHPAGRLWQIGIEEPVTGAMTPRHVIALTDRAVATSGDRHNGYVVRGRRYGHIVNPNTREPVDNGVASVSVIARSAMTADAMATALMVTGPARGIPFAARAGLPALFVLRDGSALRDVATPDFRAIIVDARNG